MNILPALIACFLCLTGQQLQAQDCTNCSGLGTVACKRPEHKLALREAKVLFCSRSMSCPVCRGMLTKPCHVCKGKSVDPGVKLGKERMRARLEKRMRLFAELPRKTGLVLCETNRVTVAVAAPSRFKVEGKTASSHLLAHLCVEQVTELRARFMQIFELSEIDFPKDEKRTSARDNPSDRKAGSPRVALYLLADMAQVRAYAPRTTQIPAQGLGVMKLGPRIAACLHFDPKTIRDGATLHRHLAHVTAHLLLSNVLPSRPLGELGHGWIEAGVAHYFEDLVTGSGCSVMCFGEQVLRPTGTYRGGNWRRAVFGLVSRKKERSASSLFSMQQEELDLEGHAQAFAFVDFLMAEKGGKQFIRLIRALPDAKDPVAVVQGLYPSAQQDLDARFRAWVLARYGG